MATTLHSWITSANLRVVHHRLLGKESYFEGQTDASVLIYDALEDAGAAHQPLPCAPFQVRNPNLHTWIHWRVTESNDDLDTRKTLGFHLYDYSTFQPGVGRSSVSWYAKPHIGKSYVPVCAVLVLLDQYNLLPDF